MNAIKSEKHILYHRIIIICSVIFLPYLSAFLLIYYLAYTQDDNSPIHHHLTSEQSDELTSHCQMMLVLIQFGAYREVLGCEGAEPISKRV